MCVEDRGAGTKTLEILGTSGKCLEKSRKLGRVTHTSHQKICFASTLLNKIMFLEYVLTNYKDDG
jgi:hypothetical protein